MHLERYGAGPEVYLGLHGWGGDHRMFAPLAARLPPSASLYSADLPGCGQSPAPKDWQVGTIVEEIIAAIETIGADRVILVGNCSGANLALLVARKLRARIAGLVLIDVFAFMPRYFQLFTNKNFGRYAYYSAFANPVGRWVGNQSLRGHRTAETDLTNSFASIDHKVAYHYLQMLSTIGALEQFKDLTMPIEIAYGERTFGAVKRSVAQWLALWPHAREWELKGAGHLPIEEATEQLCQVIFGEKENS